MNLPLPLYHGQAIPSISWLGEIEPDILQGRVVVVIIGPAKRTEAGAGAMRVERIGQTSIGRLLVHRRRRQVQRRFARVHDDLFVW